MCILPLALSSRMSRSPCINILVTHRPHVGSWSCPHVEVWHEHARRELRGKGGHHAGLWGEGDSRAGLGARTGKEAQ